MWCRPRCERSFSPGSPRGRGGASWPWCPVSEKPRTSRRTLRSSPRRATTCRPGRRCRSSTSRRVSRRWRTASWLAMPSPARSRTIVVVFGAGRHPAAEPDPRRADSRRTRVKRRRLTIWSLDSPISATDGRIASRERASSPCAAASSMCIRRRLRAPFGSTSGVTRSKRSDRLQSRHNGRRDRSPGSTCFPAGEVLISDEMRARALDLMVDAPWGSSTWERIAEGIRFPGIESWLPWLSPPKTILDDDRRHRGAVRS